MMAFFSRLLVPDPFFGIQSPERTRLFWWLNGLFLLVQGIFLFNGLLAWAALPILIGIAVAACYRMDWVLYLIALITPWSVNFSDIGLGVGISIPSEPLMVLLCLVFGLKLFLDGGLERRMLLHPVSICVWAGLLWMSFTTITSTIPLVSAKFLASHLWFGLLCYFLALKIFSNPNGQKIYTGAYLISLTGVVIYTLINHFLYGWDERAAHWVMSPFYNDHTSYAAAVALFIPVSCYFAFAGKHPAWIRLFSLVGFGLLLAGLGFSYTRAAWVSVAAVLPVLLAFWFKFTFRTVLLMLGFTGLLFFLFQTKIFLDLEMNRTDSSKDFSRHIESISNISTDASNLERINRWNSAWNMFLKKPIVGFGPGTYQFKYAPFQHSSKKTIISTNAGTQGTAHSEYLLPLSEQGFPGMVIWVFLVLLVTQTTIRLNLSDYPEKAWLFAVFLGLATYFVHAFLNNFLDTDKAAVPFWGFVAMIVAMDLRRKKESNY